jgi:hypothetical protein
MFAIYIAITSICTAIAANTSSLGLASIRILGIVREAKKCAQPIRLRARDKKEEERFVDYLPAAVVIAIACGCICSARPTYVLYDW